MRLIKQINTARELLKAGEVIAYPTEAVYGLGCDIFNEQAVLRILALKKRDKSKGLIILIADWPQLWDLIDKNAVSKARSELIKNSWPGPVTWIFPKSDKAPEWITGEHQGIAVRMTAHPVAHALCQNGPIVSTSANISGGAPARDIHDLEQFFSRGVAGVVAGELGDEATVSEIYKAVDGTLIR
ncbi:MAG: L-threonylcarbamoyladenylate synthase [Legionella sp.]|nr:L-threonylcarbamoyladenylate synthase [Legionella sp.]